jgi:hypothetical protein
MDREVHTFYSTPGRFTGLRAGEYSSSKVREVVGVVQGLVVYDLAAQPFYGVELMPAQGETIHERHVERLLDAVRALDDRPLDEPRPVARRAGARCHVFSRLTVAFLRAAGVPARARCGFGSYFQPGWLEDHWVAEVWDADAGRWQMVDAQLDATWQRMIGFTGDPLSITPTEFVTAGHAWQAWRRGDLDADRCGLTSVGEHGAHWIAGNLRLDLAALNKVEMNPWDVWGPPWEPGDVPSQALLELFDSVAELTVDPDRHLAELRERYESDDALRMDGTVLNVLRGRNERV